MIPGGPGSMQLYHVLNKRNTPGVKHLVVKEGVGVNHRFADGSFPIHISAEKGDVQSLRFLLSMKASPDAKNRHGQTALMLGIDSTEIVQVLVIEYNCKVDSRDSQQRAALHLAGARGLVPVVRILLAGGATVNALDTWHRSPLHVTLLNLSHGLSLGLLNYYSEVIKLLLDRGCDINHADKHRATPLFLAINSGNVEISKMLIDRGANINKISRHNLSPVMLASMKGFTELCQLLVWHNCNINYRSPSQGKTCSQIAVQKGHMEIVLLLAAAGGQFHAQNWQFYQNKQHWKGICKQISPKMWSWLDDFFTEPLSLQQTCRTIIRKSMGLNLHEKIAKLEYSSVLKRYILMRDIIPVLE